MKVTVKWGKESYEVSDVADNLADFQAQLFSLTLVPPQRQKLMCKGKFVKDDAQLAALPDGAALVLMGTADPPPKEPEKKIVFEEDLTDAQKIGVVKDILSAGLHNMGNTCYMASTLQCLRAIPELKQAVVTKGRSAQPQVHDPNAAVVRQLGDLFAQMDRSVESVTPLMFTTVFRSTFPQFAETNNEGHWMQQDAEEAMMQLINAMSNVLRKENVGAAAAGATDGNVIDEYFGGQMETRTQPKALPGGDAAAAAAASEAELKIGQESYRRLKCFIDGETNFLYQGLKRGLVDEFELRGRVYEKSASLLTLPPYLIIQMMRFGWRNDTQKKTKILRKVDFPMRLDVMEFCHPKLKTQLLAARNMIKEEEDEKLGLASLTKKAKTDAAQTAGTSASPPPAAAAAGSPMEVDASGSSASNPWSAAPAAAAASGSAAQTLTTPTSGYFEVFAVVTHKGRTSDSGHYVSWAKQPDGQWLKFDDEKVSKVSEDEVKRLYGGGDDHVAYLLFYKRVDDALKFKGAPVPEVATAPPTGDMGKKAVQEAKEKKAAAAASK